MTLLRTYLFAAALFIIAAAVYVAITMGINIPAVLFGDLLELNWRSHIYVDFLLHLCLLATWVTWREGFTPKSFLFGLLWIVFGAAFGFPYLLLATYEAKGNLKVLLLGVHSDLITE